MSSKDMEKGKKRHFVLVHGACHGAWCWYKVSALLKSAGHQVTALDMAASGIHPKQVHELNSITEYYEPLMEFLGSLPQEERVILVGHSLGGICISMAMEMFPKKIAAAVFVTAFMPSPNLSFVTLFQECTERLGSSLDSKVTFDECPDNHPNGSMIFGPQFLTSTLYQLSPPESFKIHPSTPRLVAGEAPRCRRTGARRSPARLYSLSPSFSFNADEGPPPPNHPRRGLCASDFQRRRSASDSDEGRERQGQPVV